jgi:hypothetical protein
MWRPTITSLGSPLPTWVGRRSACRSRPTHVGLSLSQRTTKHVSRATPRLLVLVVQSASQEAGSLRLSHHTWKRAFALTLSGFERLAGWKFAGK